MMEKLLIELSKLGNIMLSYEQSDQWEACLSINGKVLTHYANAPLEALQELQGDL